MRAVLAGRSLGYDDADDDACLITVVCPSRLTAPIRIVSLPPSLPAPRACLPACLPAPPACLTSYHRQPCLGGSGETGLVGCLVMEGGGSQVDQETRTVHRGCPLR